MGPAHSFIPRRRSSVTCAACGALLLHPQVLKQRVRGLNCNATKASPAKGKPIIYWMSRDQRVQDNWAMLYAQQCAIEAEAPVSNNSRSLGVCAVSDVAAGSRRKSCSVGAEGSKSCALLVVERCSLLLVKNDVESCSLLAVVSLSPRVSMCV